MRGGEGLVPGPLVKKNKPSYVIGLLCILLGCFDKEIKAHAALLKLFSNIFVRTVGPLIFKYWFMKAFFLNDPM